MFGTPVTLPKTLTIFLNGLGYDLRGFGEVDGFGEFQRFRIPIHLVIFWSFCQKCFFLIPKEGLDSLKGLKGFLPLSNYLHQKNLSKCRFFSNRGFGAFEEFHEFRTPIQLPITKYSVLNAFGYISRGFGVFKRFGGFGTPAL